MTYHMLLELIEEAYGLQSVPAERLGSFLTASPVGRRGVRPHSEHAPMPRHDEVC
jgi:hypothetical protein